MRSLAAWKVLGLVTVSAWTLASSVACSGSEEDPAPTDEPTGTVSWCQVRTVLAAKCQGCHTRPPLHGAPFPLVTYDDTQVLNVTIDERRWELMEIVVGEDFMPPNDPRLNPPPEKLTADEKSQLMTWFAEGAKAVGGTACD